MAIKSKTELKGYFKTGDFPTEEQFADLIDSMAHVESLPTSSTDRKGIDLVAEIGEGPVLTYPKSTWESLGTKYCGVTIIDENGYLEIIPPQFLPPDDPEELKIDVGEVLTAKRYIHLK